VSKPIVAGYDPRTPDHAPVDFAIAAAALTDAPLIVASVQAGAPVLPIAAGTVPVAIGQADRDLLADCTAALDGLAQELSAAGVRAECRKLQSTSAARALHELAEAEDARLLVIGSSRHGTVGRALMGSTATRLVHGAPCPITVVPHGWAPRGAADAIRTIGVAYVDTAEAREALRGAHALARRARATLRAVTVVKPGLAQYAETEPSTSVRPAKDVTAVEGEERVRAERALREAVAGLDGDVPVEADAFVGDPAEILIELSEQLDLLVCGSRGYGPVRAVLLGGVSRRIVANARCPVIVLPRGVSSSLEALLADVPDATTAT
jgi:nucleotide-binding universal stress UspA family protein